MKVSKRGSGGMALLALITICALQACAEGDDKGPATIGDLAWFNRADALIWNGRVHTGDTLSGDPNTRLLAWTAAGDDGGSGKAAAYDIRYVRPRDLVRLKVKTPRQAFQDHWADCRELYGERYPDKGGRLEQLLLPRLAGGDTVWFSVRAIDEIGQRSNLGNVAGPFVPPRLSVPMRETAGADAPGLGGTLMGIGDFNHDNYPDLAVGSPAAGKVHVFKGRSSRGLFKKQPNVNGVAVHRAIPEMVPWFTLAGNAADEFGAAAGAAGKLNDDAKLDLAAGAPGHDGGGADAGAVFLKYGQAEVPDVLSADSADVILTGEAAGDRFGAAIAPGFDLNGDERGELVVGAPGAYGTGAVYVFRGIGLGSGSASQAAVIIKGESAGDGFGAVIANISDVNGDGVVDIAVGAPSRDEGALAGAGAVYVFYGGNSGVADFVAAGAGPVVIDLAATKADVTIRGTSAAGNFGRSIVAAGKLASDTSVYFDFAVGAAGSVYAYLGGPSSSVPFPQNGSSVEAADIDAYAVLTGAPGEDFGRSVAGISDVNHDGKADLGVGAPGADAFYIFYGSLYDGKPPDETLDGPAGSGFGTASAGCGDMNLDNYFDFFIGAPLVGRSYFWF